MLRLFAVVQHLELAPQASAEVSTVGEAGLVWFWRALEFPCHVVDLTFAGVEIQARRFGNPPGSAVRAGKDVVAALSVDGAPFAGRTAGRGAAVSKRLQRSRNGGQQQRAVGVQVANVKVYIAFIPPSQPILKQIQNVRGCLKGIMAFNHNSAILKPQFSFTACNVVVMGFRQPSTCCPPCPTGQADTAIPVAKQVQL